MSIKNANIQYFVEGENEKRLIDVLKNEFSVIYSGKVQVFNVVEKKFSMNLLRTLKKDCIVVLVFDTDTNNIETLKSNIKTLKNCPFVSNVVTVPQVKNLEDELVRCCNIKDIKELLNSRSNKDFKTDLLSVSNLSKKLSQHNFDIDLFWNKQPLAPFSEFLNESMKIKLVAH